jgi:hypothetical protein
MSSTRGTFGLSNVTTLEIDVATGPVVLTPQQAAYLYIILVGTLTADFHLTFPTDGVWLLNTSQLAFDGNFNIIIDAGGASTAKIVSSAISMVAVSGSNRVIALQPQNVVPLYKSVSGGPVVLTFVEAASLYIVLQGALAADFDLTFPTLGIWQIDTSQVTFNGHVIRVHNGTGNAKISTASVITCSIPFVNVVTILQPPNLAPLDLSVAGGDIALTLLEAASLYIVLAGTLPADFTLTFPATGVWQVDTTQVVFNGHRIHIHEGTGTADITVPGALTVSIPATNLVTILQALTDAVVLYRPGLPSVGNVVGTWLEVQTRVDATQGVITVYVDSHLAPGNVAHIPAGTWEGYGSALLKNQGTSNVSVLNIDDGATLKNWRGAEGSIAITCDCVTTPAFAFDPFQNFTLFDFASIQSNAGALVPALRVTAAMGNFALFSAMGGISNQPAPGTPIVFVEAGGLFVAYVSVSAQNFSFLFTGSEIAGAVGGTLQWENDSTQAPFSAAGFLGTVIQVPMSDALNVPYEPANVANWNGAAPSSLANALDRIAAKIGPIP